MRLHSITPADLAMDGEPWAFLQAWKPWQTQVDASNRPTDAMLALTDETCMARYQDGDSRAFETLYLRYREKLHRYLLRLSNRPSEADEIFQEVWIAVIRGKDRYQPSAPFGSWLFSVAHRRAADRWRSLSRHAPEWKGQSRDERELESIPASTAQTPERLTDNEALGRALLDAIARLPLPQREAFLMRAEGDLSLDDIATATQVSRETVKSRLRYAHQRLRDALEAWR
jgi:RNA polymerase sigma-70 factor (ECF subfamily)